MINRAVKSTDKEIKANSKEISQVIDAIKHVKDVTKLYSEQLDKSELSDEYKDKIKMVNLKSRKLRTKDFRKPSKNMKTGMKSWKTARIKLRNTTTLSKNAEMQ